MAIKLKLLIVLTLLVGWQHTAEARLISFSPTEVNFGSVAVGDTGWDQIRFRYSGPDSGIVLITTWWARHESFFMNSPNIAPVHQALDSIYRASVRYRVDHSNDPTSVEELTELSYIRLPDDMMCEWTFTLIGNNPIGQIEAVSTVNMPEGAGHVALLNVNPYLHSGSGIDGVDWHSGYRDVFTLPVAFAPDQNGGSRDTLFIKVGTMARQSAEEYMLVATGNGLVEVKISEKAQPVGFELNSVYPNPFNSSTTITYSLPSPLMNRLVVLDETGREVALLHEGWNHAGAHRVSWNATGLPSGVYYPTLMMNGQSKSVRAVFVR